jgi:hypothetical protein
LVTGTPNPLAAVETKTERWMAATVEPKDDLEVEAEEISQERIFGSCQKMEGDRVKK